ncbi:DUF3501 family protein [Oleiagrimonas soli]|uniref:DUF3501 domain-containing protein n=1 Tax=Oleiagrimonas soli TaxID=1543381 RepID=A0A099CTM8_9GAMM|nr:DUF3501 family protein [Oleiagrimonas soli]KGI77001.1 hypothetical protein LF63_0112065 [Oleiagrimonas soli]MBB6185489.1 hypothetical protein [Oleiagrimonas soli]
MKPLTRDDLFTLETYAAKRSDFRARVIAHKKPRKVHLGEHLTLIFEDRLTIQYQIQEMLRVERIFEATGIEDELGAYNPLIPDGGNLKATMLIEYSDPEVRKRELAKLRNVEHDIALQVGDLPPVKAIADEDLERSNEEKTSAVHFMRFELDEAMRAAWKDGAPVFLSCTHDHYPVRVQLDAEQHAALGADLD